MALSRVRSAQWAAGAGFVTLLLAALPAAALNRPAPSALHGHAARAQASQAQRTALPSQLLFITTGQETVDIFNLRKPNKQGPVATISSGLVGTQYQMTTDTAGDLYVVNDNQVKLSEQYVSVYAPPYTNAPTILGGVMFPLGIAVDGGGNVYVSNCGTYCSQTPAIYVYPPGATSPTSSITSAGFKSLGGLSFDASGNLYVVSFDPNSSASDVFEIPAGSSTPKPLHLKGLIRSFGLAVAPDGDLYVGNNFTSTYILAFKPGKTNAFRILDPFSFFDLPEMIGVGPDNNLYVPLQCGNGPSCQGLVLGFKGGKKPFEQITLPGQAVNGVAAWPNPVLARTL